MQSQLGKKSLAQGSLGIMQIRRKVLGKKTYKSKLKVRSILRKMKNDELIDRNKFFYDQSDYDLALDVLEAEKFVAEYVADGGKYISARLRPGFIGNIVNVPGGASYIQRERGKPYGTIVAIPNDRGTVTLGFSYIREEDEDRSFPILGLAIALKQAINELRDSNEGINPRFLKGRAKQQAIYFEKRALAYFNPDVYSWSRGQKDKKVTYDNYEEIHKRREMILGIDSSKSSPKKKTSKNKS